MIFPVKCVPCSLEILESMPQMGSIFSKFLFHCEDVGFAAGEVFNLSGKHTYNNKNILVIYTKWQLNEVQLQVFEGSRGRRSEASGNKNSLFVKCTMVGKGM